MFSSALFYHRLSMLCRAQRTCITMFAKNVPDILMQTAKAAMSFGGELEPSRARGLDKFMLKLMKCRNTGCLFDVIG